MPSSDHGPHKVNCSLMVQFYESACVVFPLTAAKPFVCAGQSKNSSDSIDAPDNLLCWRESKYISREGCFFSFSYSSFLEIFDF